MGYYITKNQTRLQGQKRICSWRAGPSVMSVRFGFSSSYVAHLKPYGTKFGFPNRMDAYLKPYGTKFGFSSVYEVQ